jgi:hypothetical protein
MHEILYTYVFSSIFYQDVKLDDSTYPTWALALGWMAVIICPGWLLYMFFVKICRCGTWSVCLQFILVELFPFYSLFVYRSLKKLVYLMITGNQSDKNIVNCRSRYVEIIDAKNLSRRILSTTDIVDLDSDAMRNGNYRMYKLHHFKNQKTILNRLFLFLL